VYVLPHHLQYLCTAANNVKQALLIIQSAFIALGYPLSTAMGLAARQAEPSSFAWRWPIAFQGIFLILIFISLPFLPESPRWLIQQGRIREATEVFARLESSNVDDPKVITERDMVAAAIKEEHDQGHASWAEVFTEGKERTISRVLLGAGPYLSEPQFAPLILVTLLIHPR